LRLVAVVAVRFAAVTVGFATLAVKLAAVAMSFTVRRVLSEVRFEVGERVLKTCVVGV
jgi:hypothetical protein